LQGYARDAPCPPSFFSELRLLGMDAAVHLFFYLAVICPFFVSVVLCGGNTDPEGVAVFSSSGQQRGTLTQWRVV
jgi:hypothetical protein